MVSLYMKMTVVYRIFFAFLEEHGKDTWVYEFGYIDYPDM
jgi:hypothetical protein